MKRKSSKMVSLILISSLLASCSQTDKKKEERQRVFMRSDSSAPYTEVTEEYQNSRSGRMGSAFLWYMAFRPLIGNVNGYASQGIHSKSNIGNNTTKANAIKRQTVRSGFGNTFRSSSAS